MEDSKKTKEQLEVEKLELEILNGKKPLYKKLSFYSALSPIVFSIVAILFSLFSGLFEMESKILTIKKENLKYEINNFENKKETLISITDNLKNEKDSLLLENNDLRSQNSKMKSLSTKLTKELNQLKKIVVSIQDSVMNKQMKLDSLYYKYEKLKNDKVQLAAKMKELEDLIYHQLMSNEQTKIVFEDILKILDENLGGFSSSSMLLLFSP